MTTYKVSFNGRQSGAIGITYHIKDTYQDCKNLDELKSLLYEDYELIKNLRVDKEVDYFTGRCELVTRDEFDSAKFIKVRSWRKRERSPNTGTYKYMRSDAPKDYKW